MVRPSAYVSTQRCILRGVEVGRSKQHRLKMASFAAVAFAAVVSGSIWYTKDQQPWRPAVLAHLQKRSVAHSVNRLDNGDLHVWEVVLPASDQKILMSLIEHDRAHGMLMPQEWDEMPRFASSDLTWFVYLSARPGQGSYDGTRPADNQVLCVVTHYVKHPWYEAMF